MKYTQIFQMPLLLRFVFYILVAATLFTLGTCFKETSGYMNCKIGGTDFKATSVGASTIVDTIRISGKQGDVLIRLEVSRHAVKGSSYSFGEEYVAEYNGDWPVNLTASTQYTGGNGTITIIDINEKHIKATFSFEASYYGDNFISVSVTDGEFDVTF